MLGITYGEFPFSLQKPKQNTHGFAIINSSIERLYSAYFSLVPRPPPQLAVTRCKKSKLWSGAWERGYASLISDVEEVEK